MGALAAYRRVLANGRLARLMAGEFISSIGDWLYLVALLILVYEETEDPVILGAVGAGRILPFLLLAVPAGIVADRFDRRSILLATNIVRGLLQLVLAALAFVAAPTASIVAVAILAACASAFFGPAIGAYLPSLVDDERDLGPANSLWATLDDLAFFVGPAVAGVLIAGGGLPLAFILNAISYLFVTIVTLGLPARPPSADELAAADDGAGAGEGAAAPAPGGWRAIVGRVPGIVVLDGATAIVGSGLGVLTVVIAYQSLSAGEEVTGYLNAATGIGGIVAGFVAGWLVVRRLDLPIIGASVVATAALLVLGLTGSVPVALVAIGIASGALLVLDVISATVLQRAVEDAQRGRAMGVLQVTSSLAMIVGAFAAPVLADIVGIVTALFAMGAVAVAVDVVAVALLRPTGALAPSGVADRRLELLRASGFGGLSPARLEAAARAMSRVEVAAGERVVDQGAVADRFFFIDRGRFVVTQTTPDGREVTVNTMGPGEAFGELGLLLSGRRTASVTAETDGVLFALDRDAFLDLVNAGPGLSNRLLDLHRGAAATARSWATATRT